MYANYFSYHSAMKAVDLLVKSLFQCRLFRVVKNYAFYMGGEEFYFQFFGNLLTFEEIFEDVVTRDRQYFPLHYACFGVEP